MPSARTPDDFDILAPETVEDPYPFFAALREHAPVYPVAKTGIYLVSKRALIEEALDRQEDFSANLTGVLMTGPGGEPHVFDLSVLGGTVDAIANADEPAHSIHRKLILPSVTPKVVAGLEDTFREWAVELIDPLLAHGGGDWIDAVANPLPTRAMAQVVGLPLQDVDQLLEWAMTGTEILAGTITIERIGQAAATTIGLTEYLGKHVESALASPADRPAPGVIGELAAGVRAGVISESDAVSILVVLVGAGGESTSSLTGSAVRALAEHSDLQEELRAKPARIPDFVEEVLRLEPSFRGHYRHVNRDTSLGGVELPQGSRILLLWAAANRDPSQFANPDAIDIDRPGLREHLSFGRGIHFCIGARLARLEARVILEELLARTGSFALAPDRVPRYVSSIFVRRHAELEITTTPPASATAHRGMLGG
jgi:cytochrome P450